jgi:hypothetical protein
MLPDPFAGKITGPHNNRLNIFTVHRRSDPSFSYEEIPQGKTNSSFLLKSWKERGGNLKMCPFAGVFSQKYPAGRSGFRPRKRTTVNPVFFPKEYAKYP